MKIPDHIFFDVVAKKTKKTKKNNYCLCYYWILLDFTLLNIICNNKHCKDRTRDISVPLNMLSVR